MMHHPLLISADLDFPLGSGPAVYRDLVDAVDALLRGEPDHRDLLGKLDEMRADGDEDARLPVNIENIVIQSGRDRKALVGKTPRYPKLARFIRDIRPTHGVSQNTSALIERLQEEAREWKQRERVLRSKLAEKDLQLASARREALDSAAEAKRWRTKKG
ncbi:hypothetical protein [Sphingomonas corticis]|uniref:Uncharacterized protein n=1 Tax=Sphingomonas corticis TaxID=2722791 RepID=A0ABX1CTI1_9SPHN|nr:hypothetical protein [Sphingomonas corticis]NJR80273.1 hypothetical protein [Sphingomonas corticis]